MSFGRLFHGMMGVVLCLMMQLPPFIMHAAMAGERGMVSLPAYEMASTHGHDMSSMSMMVLKEASSGQIDMEGGMAPCCQGHHAVCDAGLVPEARTPEPAQGWQTAFLLYEVRASLRSSIVPPWRPPAVLPV